MEFYYQVIYGISNLFRIYVIYRFVRIFFQQLRVDKRMEFIIYAGFFVASTGLNILFHMPVLNLCVNIAFLFGITALYQDSFVKKVLSVVFIYVVNLATDVIGVMVLQSLLSFEIFELAHNIILNLVYFIAELVIEKFIVSKKEQIIPNRQGLLLMLIPSISIVSIVLLVYYGAEMLSITQSIAILFINMLTFYLYDWTAVAYREKYEKDMLERQMLSYANQVELLHQTYGQLRSLKHDIKHHMIYLTDSAKKYHNQDVLDYLEKMQGEIENAKEYVKTGNEGFDSILNYMISEANKLTDNIDVKVRVPDNLTIDKFDINIILGNLLQNAIEAMHKTEKKSLKINLEYAGGVLYINISNHYAGKIEKKGSIFSTSKENSAEHGIGLLNIQRIVDKYNGIMEIDTKDNNFMVNIMLYIK